MTRSHRARLHLALQIAVWTLVVVSLLGPHQRWSVCLTGACTGHAADHAAAQAAAACCSGCCDDEDAGVGENGTNGANPCGGCCLDLAIAIDEAPVPTPVQAPPPDHAVVAVLPQLRPASSEVVAARFLGHGAGPPAPDRRSALVAVTVLRE